MTMGLALSGIDMGIWRWRIILYPHI